MRAKMAVWSIAAAALAVPATGWAADAPVEPTSRSVYVTVLDKDGQPVGGLTPADFKIKEDGKERAITAVAPPSVRAHVSILIEESLSADSNVRQGTFDFAKQIIGQADIALVLVGLRNVTVVDYTNDLNAIVNAINGFSLRQSPLGEHMTEGIYEAARTLDEKPLDRPILVALALETAQDSAEDPKRVLEQLSDSGAVLHAVTIPTGQQVLDVGQMADFAERGQVLGDGTKQSGGQRIEVNGTTGIPIALQKIAAEIEGQYLISYTLPDGVKPSNKLNVSLERKGATLHAPTRIPK